MGGDAVTPRGASAQSTLAKRHGAAQTSYPLSGLRESNRVRRFPKVPRWCPSTSPLTLALSPSGGEGMTVAAPSRGPLTPSPACGRGQG